MKRLLALIILALSSTTTAHAIDYFGKFKGVVTRGEIYRNPFVGPSSTESLVGRPVDAYFSYTERPGYDPEGLPTMVGWLTICDLVCSSGGEYSSPSSMSFETDGNVFSGFAFDWMWGGAQNSWSSNSVNFNKATKAGGGSGFLYYYFGEQWSYEWEITSGSVYAVVPEPKTWLQLIVGIGFAGLALRRSRGIAGGRARIRAREAVNP